MKSPKDHNIIQIDITNACTHRCSNCTRFCGHQIKPFMMETDTFQQAVDSLQGFDGMIGVMGGEPTLHPHFDTCARYLADHFGPRERHPCGRLPIRDFAEYRIDHFSDVTGKRGLWTSLGDGYYRHFELIQELFDYQCINDHLNPGLHQALLVTRKELGITDAEWIPLRDACWIQNLWSSCITPKGAFFCEIAGALDMLFDGPGGWPIEPGWWKRTPAEFGDQLQWCELCSAALQVPRRRANEEVDDISPLLLEKLSALNSPKIRQRRFALMDTAHYSANAYACKPTSEWYLPDADAHQRVAGTNASLHPRSITAIVPIAAPPGSLMETLRANAQQVDRLIVATTPPMETAIRKDCEPLHIPVTTVNINDLESLVAQVLPTLSDPDWILLLSPDVQLAPNFSATIKNWILNPGCLYEAAAESQALPARLIRSSASVMADSGDVYFRLFQVRAQALREKAAAAFPDRWPQEKRVSLTRFCLAPDEAKTKKEQADWMEAHVCSLWSALSTSHQRIALYGAGRHTQWLLARVKARNLPPPCLILDDNPAESAVNGIPVKKPDAQDADRFDVILASTTFERVATKMKARCDGLWSHAKPTLWPYDFFPKDMLNCIYRQS